jgi:hypothetical protein
MAITITHVRARYTNNSLIQQLKFMKFLPHIKHHMISMTQKFHFICSPTFAVMKMTTTTNKENLDVKICF